MQSLRPHVFALKLPSASAAVTRAVESPGEASSFGYGYVRHYGMMAPVAVAKLARESPQKQPPKTRPLVRGRRS